MKKIISVILAILISILIAKNVLASTGTVNVEELNLRESASTSSKILGKLVTGTKLTILATEGDWYKVNYNGKEGYVSKTYIKDVVENESNTSKNTTDSGNLNNTVTTKSENSSTTTTSNSGVPITQGIENNTKITEDTTLYVLPLLNSTKLNSIKKDTQVLLISVNGGWAYIQTETESGWVMSSKLELTKIVINGMTNNSETTNENNTSSRKVEKNNTVENITESIETNENTTSTENATNENATNSGGNSTTENTTNTSKNDNSNEVTTNSISKYPTTMYVNVDAVNIRSQASTSSSKVTSVGKNVPVKVTGKEGDWYKVEVSDGKGYILGTYLSQQKQ